MRSLIILDKDIPVLCGNGFSLFAGKGAVRQPLQWAALPRDCKAVRSVAETEDHGAYRYRRTMDNNFRLVNVYITDMKITEIPQK